MNETKNISEILSELSNHLMINGSMVFFSGLLYGKLGISLFFFHYSRYTGNPLYNEYALHLVDLVKSQIHDDYPLDYERGLAGVGSGFEYLKKHGYFDVGEEMTHQIDSKIIKAVGYERRENMLTEFRRYLTLRFESFPDVTIKDTLIQIESYLSSPIETLIKEVPENRITEIVNFFDLSDLDELFSKNHNFVLQGGYAGLGLALMSITDTQNDSWINLLQI